MAAPPVARAAKAFTSSTFTVSTRDTAEMAASPTWETMMESSRPTVMASSCSMTSGTISRRRSRLVNSICIAFGSMGAPSQNYRNSRGFIWKVFRKARRKVEYSEKPTCSAAFITGMPSRMSSPARRRRFWLIYW